MTVCSHVIIRVVMTVGPQAINDCGMRWQCTSTVDILTRGMFGLATVGAHDW
eukprot:m.150270 g.150270  ORF g.150270 m.150270 type:complete len:52 (-) comp14225_c0_seq6:1913-2068(-)